MDYESPPPLAGDGGPSAAAAIRAVDPSSGTAQPAARPVVIVTPGGLEHGGGIGRMIGYFTACLPRDIAADLRIIDSRGTGHVAWFPLFVIRAMALIALWRARGPLLHIHIAGRASTLRKVLICGFARALRTPYILHLHDYNYAAFYAAVPKPLRWAIPRIFRAAKRVIVLGQRDAELMTEGFGVRPDRVRIFHNAVPAPHGPARPDRAEAACRILFLGRLSARKGVPELLAALARPELAGLCWEATLAGDGDLEPYRRIARDSGIGQRVSFPGWLDSAGTEALLRQADILVLPSYEEGMAMSVLEGMAHGLCVVATPVGALAEVLEDDVSARLVTPGDVTGLAHALAETIGDRLLRRRLGAGARARFRAGHSVDRYAERLAALYREVGAGNAVRG